MSTFNMKDKKENKLAKRPRLNDNHNIVVELPVVLATDTIKNATIILNVNINVPIWPIVINDNEMTYFADEQDNH